MEINRNGSRPSQKGPEQYFTGTVRIDPIIQAPEPSRVTAGLVTFEPGARSARPTHPRGQTVIVTQGVGWTQGEGEPIAEIRAGDVIWCPPNHRHWHGATPTTAMTHIAIQEALDGKNVVWVEEVEGGRRAASGSSAGFGATVISPSRASTRASPLIARSTRGHRNAAVA